MRPNYFLSSLVNTKLVIIFLLTLTLGLFQTPSAQCQNESSIGSFYTRFNGSTAKIAARNTNMTTKYQAFLTDLNIDSARLGGKLTDKIAISFSENKIIEPELLLTFDVTYAKSDPNINPSYYYSKQPFKLLTVKRTAYYGPKKGQKEYFHKTFQEEKRINGSGDATYYGTKPYIGIVAADHRIFPKGTILIVPNALTGKEEVLIADDRGKDIIGNWIDVFAGWGEDGFERVKTIQNAGNKVTIKVIQPSA